MGCTSRLDVLRLLAVILAFQGGGGCLRLVEVRIPPHTQLGGWSRLECDYDLQGEALYSVKWYKDGHEFYRYVPRDMPRQQLFPLDGIQVDLANSTDHVVQLSHVSLQTAGRYRCEVSGEAPSFQTVSQHGDMVVVAVPEEGPRIIGGRPRYHLGENVTLTCISGRSFPAAQLSWFVNGEQVNQSLVSKPTTTADKDGLLTSTLLLQFVAEAGHFAGGDLKLKCLASLPTADGYWRTNEESAQHLPHPADRARALQSRATPLPAIPPTPPPTELPQTSDACGRQMAIPRIDLCLLIFLWLRR